MSTLKNPVTKKVKTKTVEVTTVTQVDITVSKEVAVHIMEAMNEYWSPLDADGLPDETGLFMQALETALED